MTQRRIALLIVVNLLSMVAAWKHLADLSESWWGPAQSHWVVITALWLLFPLMAIIVGILCRRNLLGRKFFGSSFVYCLTYLFYALRRPPEDGMHMQIFIVPAYLAFLTVGIVLDELWRNCTRH